ncbi:hypothetical protein Aab01nite_65080 [Paractinoplanes abujensis]|nr:hypothetical protein Aab01nite_65080 [Actinoplanes abujensis]
MHPRGQPGASTSEDNHYGRTARPRRPPPAPPACSCGAGFEEACAVNPGEDAPWWAARSRPVRGQAGAELEVAAGSGRRDGTGDPDRPAPRVRPSGARGAAGWI